MVTVASIGGNAKKSSEFIFSESGRIRNTPVDGSRFGSVVGMLKTIDDGPVAAFAAVIAARKDPAGIEAPMPSAVVVTVKTFAGVDCATTGSGWDVCKTTKLCKGC